MAGDVGLTALLVAAARAIEATRPDSLAQDQFAQHFVRAAGVDWPVSYSSTVDSSPLWSRLGRYFGLRTRLLDDFIPGSAQTVLLGAGLDTRAFRLPWPPDSHVFELDRGPVLDFKHQVLSDIGAAPLVKRTPVDTDLRGNWSAALLDAGFCPGLPTTWIAEGLLLYLSSAAETSLMRTINTLSEPGSRLFYEIKLAVESPAVRASPLYSTTLAETGIDLLALFSENPRPDSVSLLSALGWDVSVHTCFDYTARYGAGPVPVDADPLAGNRWVIASTDPSPA
ncbi:SAM-dependent methyltransferase [Kutzneria sp. CA-103260]|uniref:SAM-dependent methyltransferase n=1 Tax=Kutzneria sp. CA-103260 TaxID=2802641 RepID=UPI001BEF385A|nr:SAM-dependent methyltransferase [Kutzneria sp. CA-103260]QUQ66642.1 SAM-dependent methyltransferase [Kutzneria sp. CA-103260]